MQQARQAAPPVCLPPGPCVLQQWRRWTAAPVRVPQSPPSPANTHTYTPTQHKQAHTNTHTQTVVYTSYKEDGEVYQSDAVTIVCSTFKRGLFPEISNGVNPLLVSLPAGLETL